VNALFISATQKSSGKTTVTLGLAAALAARDKTVQTFKKGPDYIDPLWLSRASCRPCRNLDFHTMSNHEIAAAFQRHCHTADVALIEGNKGLFDGVDVEGSDSNAALAHLLDVPVVLVIDTRGMTRGIAPLVSGYVGFDGGVRIAGVILNQVGGPRHEGKLRAALEYYTDVPVLGALGRHPDIAIAERHLGLVPANEAADADALIAQVADVIAAGVDLERVAALTAGATGDLHEVMPAARTPNVRIAIAQDAAFGFYYPDDLEALARAGAELVPFDTLSDAALPPADGLFIGGGFPETQAAGLAANESLRRQIRNALEGGMPAYAECGGLIYLSRGLSWRGEHHDMVGFVPGDTVLHDRPVGRGYATLKETGVAPWSGSPVPGTLLYAHEFHHASLENLPGDLDYAYQVTRGHGIDGRRDGLVLGNLLAGFCHQRDVAANRWAGRCIDFVRACRAGQNASKSAMAR
jgi:cobyrinic acid a,c-diamide synthase